MRDLKSLKVYGLARQFVKDVYRLPCGGYGCIVAHLRKTVISIKSNIAEGARRASRKDFKRFLDMANGSASEAWAQLESCGDVGEVKQELVDTLMTDAEILGKSLTRFMSRMNTD